MYIAIAITKSNARVMYVSVTQVKLYLIPHSESLIVIFQL